VEQSYSSSQQDEVPFVVIGHGEPVPWGDDYDRICPQCGEKDLPLLDSVPPGLHYIEHCGGVWMRGPITFPRDPS
jgi:hypothetical protein